MKLNAREAWKQTEEINNKELDQEFLTDIYKQIHRISLSGRAELVLDETLYNIYNRAFRTALKEEGYRLVFDGKGKLEISWRGVQEYDQSKV